MYNLVTIQHVSNCYTRAFLIVPIIFVQISVEFAVMLKFG